MQTTTSLLNEIFKDNKTINKIDLSHHQAYYFKGLSGSLKALSIGYLFNKQAKRTLCILKDKEEAAYFLNDLKSICPKEQIMFFPFSYKRTLTESKQDSSSILLRTETLNKLQHTEPIIVVSYPEALIEKVRAPKNLKNSILKIQKGEELPVEFIQQMLDDQDFEHVDFVYEPGQYSRRGSILDIFSFSNKHPYRIDFFGDEIESIRTFDINSQLSKEKKNQISIIPNTSFGDNSELSSFLNYFGKGDWLIANDLNFCIHKIEEIVKQHQKDETIAPQLIETNEFKRNLVELKTILIGGDKPTGAQEIIFRSEPQPAFKKNFELVFKDLKEKEIDLYKGYILSENQTQIERLSDIFYNQEVKTNLINVNTNLHEGYIDHDNRYFIYTDHQIFDRFHKHQIKTKFAKEGSITLQEINELKVGDYVVHQDHGIGKFVGLHTIDVNGKEQESIRLQYRDNDVLFVSIHSLHRISKYKGKEGSSPKIYKLGSGVWQKTKAKTKKKVKDIAKDLIALYAKRLQKKGFAYSPDSYLQEQLEASFLYEDTPDQYKATMAVKEDMEKDIPMDRLICGDVGFGKTEIAIRAAFKAAVDGKQTAILVPTTILAFQHFNTFSQRMKGLPIKIEYLSRLKTTKQQTEIKRQLESGEIDIIIGTHKLVSKSIKFKDLGLLVVDEEQKFGVAMKEKLKQIKVNVDTLTLTATPIPRTLQFSLMGARDLSIINTPPPNRYPVQTELHTFSIDIIKEAIDYEVNRGGQVFFIHNRVQNIHEVEQMINRACPDVSTIVAHGQMEGSTLENTMLDFMNGKYGVLIATTIIESGLDIPNANTIIVNNANNFGLSTLHQLRGRVGRTNKKAFAYFLAPEPSILTNEASRRLKAIEDFSELGSGFNISLQDLDIRGAGDILGGEQSGFITDIGFETYQKILQEAIGELKQEEFKELFEEEQKIDKTKIDQINFVTDCQIDTDLELRFPNNYIQNVPERMKLYRELDHIQEEKDLQLFTARIEDRFGTMPKQAKELCEVIRLRILAIRLGIERISIKSNKMKCYFIADQESLYYESSHFTKVLEWVKSNINKSDLKDVKNKLILTIASTKSIYKAIEILNNIDEIIL